MSEGHRLPVRVYYEDTDAGGICYHTAYLRFAERARTEFLRDLGFDHVGLRESTGGSFVVVRAEADFLCPARLDDALVVETRILEAGGASTTMSQIVRRDGEDLVRLIVRLAFLNPDGRPGRMPQGVRCAFDRAA